MIKQTNTENVGIDASETVAGYQHHDGLHFEGPTCDALHNMFENLSKDILDNFKDVKYVLDVGSGAGHLRHWLLKLNPDLVIVTLDGNKETVNSPFLDLDNHFILRTDVDYELVDENGERIIFDLICSFEHFEHIEPSSFDVFMSNLIKHSKSDTCIIASAANWLYTKPEERHVHCNVKTGAEWHTYLTTNFNLTKMDVKILNKANWGGRLTSCSELIYKVN